MHVVVFASCYYGDSLHSQLTIFPDTQQTLWARVTIFCLCRHTWVQLTHCVGSTWNKIVTSWSLQCICPLRANALKWPWCNYNVYMYMHVYCCSQWIPVWLLCVFSVDHSYSSVRKLVKLESVQFTLENHTVSCRSTYGQRNGMYCILSLVPRHESVDIHVCN